MFSHHTLRSLRHITPAPDTPPDRKDPATPVSIRDLIELARCPSRWASLAHASDFSPARVFHAQVAADGSGRCLGLQKNAPTAVGGYSLLANRAEGECSSLSRRTTERAESGALGR
jgi:hypothetical protein